jgi:uncharacterized RDD family membrane protein YckC
MRALLGSDDLVTGEAVALDLPAATVGVRIASGLIDVLVQLVLLVVVVLVGFQAVSTTDQALLGEADVVGTVLVFVVVPTATETLTRG